jgi:serine/threonine protein kinase
MAEACLANSSLAAREGRVPSTVPKYGLPADIWAAGILTYELMVGGPPFEADTKEETYDRIMTFKLWLPSHLSELAQDFIKKVSSLLLHCTLSLKTMRGEILHCIFIGLSL